MRVSNIVRRRRWGRAAQCVISYFADGENAPHPL